MKKEKNGAAKEGRRKGRGGGDTWNGEKQGIHRRRESQQKEECEGVCGSECVVQGWMWVFAFLSLLGLVQLVSLFYSLFNPFCACPHSMVGARAQCFHWTSVSVGFRAFRGHLPISPGFVVSQFKKQKARTPSLLVRSKRTLSVKLTPYSNPV